MSQGTGVVGHQPTQEPEGTWLSFPALFSDGDRGLIRHNEAEESDARSDRSDASGLWAVRLDISDIQEAIENHDLWVKECVTMRTDIDGLQENLMENLRAHENWMGDLSGALRKIQEQMNRFEIEILELRRRVGGTDGAPAIPPATVTADAKRVSNKRESASATVNGGRGGTAALAIPSPASKKQDPLLLGVVDECKELGLTQQVAKGLRMLTAVECNLVQQFDEERLARRAAIADRRADHLEMFPSNTSLTTPAAGDSTRASLVGGTNAGTYETSSEASTRACMLEFHPPDEILKRHQVLPQGPDLDQICNVLTLLECRAKDRTSEDDMSLAELHAEFAALLADQQLQSVAGGAPEPVGNRFSQQTWLCYINTLEELVLAGQKDAAQKSSFLENPQEILKQAASSGHGSGWPKPPLDVAVGSGGQAGEVSQPARENIIADVLAPRLEFQGDGAEFKRHASSGPRIRTSSDGTLADDA